MSATFFSTWALCIRPPFVVIIFSYALLVLVAYILPQNNERPSTMILLFLFLISFIPITTFYAMSSQTSVMPLLCITFVFCIYQYCRT
jgi:hypothetical protein